MYKNPDYVEKILKVNPPQEFINIFIASLNKQLTPQQKMQIIYALYNYSKNKISFDNNNHHINIRKRNY